MDEQDYELCLVERRRHVIQRFGYPGQLNEVLVAPFKEEGYQFEGEASIQSFGEV